MAEAPKSFTYARLLKSPSTSYASTRDTGCTCDRQYNLANREWSTSTKSDSFQRYTQQDQDETKPMHDQADAQYLSPMERWEKEDIRKSPWNNIASYTTVANTTDHQSRKYLDGHDDNWSMTGNAQSEK